MLKTTMSGAFAVAFLAMATPAAAENVTADLDLIAKVLQEEGMQAKIEGDEGKKYILSGLSGYTFQILPYGCNDAGADCKWVQFRAAFTPEKKPSLKDINQFAAENFFGRFYIDHEEDPIIEMDIDLEVGGMSRELFIDNIAYWDSIMVKYADFVFSNDE
ncbi:YbjN domain-containing protein [Qipengyuania vesicularis]|uniref:YbjN domain-containing protein n=1 Tax=Qipengyuania vesicularis TaxID=2867232 RepID=UPI001C86AEC0|nr:YbjN domain-containing protein [Qipengyuania vesicularis]MBX7526898.1 YbjN domain-containing protein [Qipengyuania vesicularis]